LSPWSRRCRCFLRDNSNNTGAVASLALGILTTAAAAAADDADAVVDVTIVLFL